MSPESERVRALSERIRDAECQLDFARAYTDEIRAEIALWKEAPACPSFHYRRLLYAMQTERLAERQLYACRQTLTAITRSA